MALSKNERLYAWLVGGVLALYVADQYIVTPYFDQRAKLADLREKTTQDEQNAFQIHRQENALKSKWAQHRDQGLAAGPQEAQAQLLGAIESWARLTGFHFASVKLEQDRSESKKELREIQVQLSGTGPKDGMAFFMIHLWTAKFPVRVTEFQTGTTPNSTELALQMRISTLYLIEDKKDGGGKKDDKKVAAKRKETGSRED